MGTTFKYILIIVILLSWHSANAAPVLQWDASSGAEGYNVYCGPTPNPTPSAIDVGANVTHDFAGSLVAGTEYECWVTAYLAGFPESGHSNHLVFTPPAPPEIVVLPGPPPGITITW